MQGSREQEIDARLSGISDHVIRYSRMQNPVNEIEFGEKMQHHFFLGSLHKGSR